VDAWVCWLLALVVIALAVGVPLIVRARRRTGDGPDAGV